jgi:tetratricopeptide (TPR) repeat protein
LSQGEHAAARPLIQQALEISQQLGDRRGIAESFYRLAQVADHRQAVQEERWLLEQSLSLSRELGDRRGTARALHQLGYTPKDEGDYTAARLFFEESLALFRELGNPSDIAWATGNLGVLAKQEGRFEEARSLLENSLAVYEKLGNARRAGVPPGSIYRVILAMVATEQRDFGKARQLLREVMAGSEERGYHYERIYALEAMAGLAAAQGQSERAARLFGAAEALRQATGSPLPASERNDHQRIVASARAALGEEAFAAAWAEGRTKTLEQAVDYALQEPLAEVASANPSLVRSPTWPPYPWSAPAPGGTPPARSGDPR